MVPPLEPRPPAHSSAWWLGGKRALRVAKAAECAASRRSPAGARRRRRATSAPATPARRGTPIRAAKASEDAETHRPTAPARVAVGPLRLFTNGRAAAARARRSRATPGETSRRRWAPDTRACGCPSRPRVRCWRLGTYTAPGRVRRASVREGPREDARGRARCRGTPEARHAGGPDSIPVGRLRREPSSILREGG